MGKVLSASGFVCLDWLIDAPLLLINSEAAKALSGHAQAFREEAGGRAARWSGESRTCCQRKHASAVMRATRHVAASPYTLTRLTESDSLPLQRG